MKNYKLLKDLPFAKAGEIFKEMLDGDEKVLAPEKWVNFRHEIFVEELDNIDEWFEEFSGTIEYFYINSYGKISKIRYNPDIVQEAEDHLSREVIGNSFETYEEAEKRLEWLKAKKVLLEDTKGFKPDWDNLCQSKWYVEYNHYKTCLEEASSDVCSAGVIYFRQQDIENSMKTHEKEWKIYLKVE